MAAHHEQAAGAATTERSSGSSLLREVAEVVVLAVILYVGISFAVQAVHVEGLSMFATLDNNYPRNGSDGEVIPANSYFVMGDNRNRSQDSRFFGPITRDRIDGKAWFRIWPIDHFGNIYGQVPTLETGTTFAGWRQPAA